MLEKFLYYLDPRTFFNRKKGGDINTTMMHGMNRISILMFIVCLCVIVYKYLHQ